MKKRLFVLFFVAALMSIPWASAHGKNGLDEQHYLVYFLPDPVTFVEPITLIDQFVGGEYLDFVLTHFANPVEKTLPDGNVVGPILDPLAHQTWWEFFDPQPELRVVDIDNQFGRQQLNVHGGRFLVLPAGKDNPDVPNRNHYKCYDAEGPPMDLPFVLVDQFGIFHVTVFRPVLFCNPVEKIRATGQVYEILNPEAHMTCYELDPPNPVMTGHNAFDQFGVWNIRPEYNEWLCVPTLKLRVVGTDDSSWGRVKSLYNN
jgi:hypothetical protein